MRGWATASVSTELATSRRLKRILFWFPIVYVVFLIGLMAHRSSLRKSILIAPVDANDGGVGPNSDSAAAGDSKVLVQDFHRLEFKNGKPIWEVRARDARYYPAELVTHVNDVSLIIFQEKGRTVQVSAETAKLDLGGGSMKKAELAGNVLIRFDDGLSLSGNAGEFDAKSREFSMREQAEIRGAGYEISGVGLYFAVESGLGRLERDVRCVFQTGAKVPRSITFDQKKP